ncbi:glycosyltransferase family 4 protein [Patescibacteria group bacterium]|nr:glycosyltransferase family 4 protein [Patescibacteria group bacterium]
MGKSNNVFMVGWEYPPNNSGGLGVACQGLTEELANQNTKIKFSLPYNVSSPVAHMDIIGCTHPNWKNNQKINGTYGPPFFAYSQEFAETQPMGSIENSGYSFDISKLRKFPESEFEKRVNEYAKVVSQAGQAFRDDFDVIHAHDWMSFPAAEELKRKTGKPMIAHVHSTEFDRAGLNSGNQYIAGVEYAGMNSANHVIAVSYYTKNLLVHKYGVDANKISVVHNGISKLNTPPDFGNHHFAQKRPVIVFMGRLTMQKGVTYFLDLASEVLKNIPNALFVVAGSGDMYHELLFKTANANLSASVVFSGFVRDKQKNKLLDRADVFVMPSVSEPFGLVAMEAAQRHTPVIVSKNSGVGEVLTGAQMIDFWDIKKMSETIVGLVGDKQYSETVVNEQLKNVDSQTWKGSAQKVKRIYEKFFLGK